MVPGFFMSTARSRIFLPFGDSVTLNPSDKGADLVLSNGNLTAASSASDLAWDLVRATIGKAWGNWYWEVTITQAANTTSNLILGAGDVGVSLASYPGFDSNSAGVQTGSYNIAGTYTSHGSGPSVVASDVHGFALDCARGEIYISRNGVWVNSGVPQARTGPAITGAIGVVYPMLGVNGSGATVGGDKMTVNFGATAFAFGPPN